MKNFAFIFILTLSSHVFSQYKYFTDYRKLADSLEVIYQIPACVMLSVAYIESGGGTSNIAKKLHNHFGIRGKNDVAVSGYKSGYRYFPTIRDSYIGFCKLVESKKYYATMKGSQDHKKWLVSIASSGYAKDANLWSTTIYGVLKKNCKN